ncbi:hypothetical protein [Lentilactobacillus parabuchneri]|jgi:hypothetical protein|uniref:Uncharacterized protein n=1 Tax=Lentilactobacillus parabuchneri TaxID=152331 RepID=A0A844EJL7_9LACO|nr:hypothetical protein [Lentilactobacillus parabuchneri]
MPIYVKQTDKLGNINHASKDMAKVYGKNKLVFQHYLPAGTVLYDILSAYGGTGITSGFITPEIKKYYDFGKPSIAIPFSKIKNGIQIQTSSVTYQDKATSNVLASAISGGYFAVSGLPTSFQISKKSPTVSFDFAPDFGTDATLISPGKLFFSIKNDSLVVDMSEIQANFSFVGIRSMPVYPIIKTITTY